MRMLKDQDVLSLSHLILQKNDVELRTIVLEILEERGLMQQFINGYTTIEEKK